MEERAKIVDLTWFFLASSKNLGFSLFVVDSHVSTRLEIQLIIRKSEEWKSGSAEEERNKGKQERKGHHYSLALLQCVTLAMYSMGLSCLFCVYLNILSRGFVSH